MDPHLLDLKTNQKNKNSPKLGESVMLIHV